MLNDVRAGTIRGSDRPFPKIILVLNTSRFSRLHELDTLALYNVLREHDVKLVSIDDRKVYDFDGFAQIIDLLVKAKEDKEYSREIAQNVLRGHDWTTKLGRCHQRFSPYGMAKLVVTDKRKNWRVAGGGYGIHWPDIDEDLSTEGLLRGAPAPRAASAKVRSDTAGRTALRPHPLE